MGLGVGIGIVGAVFKVLGGTACSPGTGLLGCLRRQS